MLYLALERQMNLMIIGNAMVNSIRVGVKKITATMRYGLQNKPLKQVAFVVTRLVKTLWFAMPRVGIKAARTEGLISSEVMKHRFVGKLIVYILCMLAAVLADVAMIALHQPTWAVPLVAGYLVVTELLSICENLNDAGIEAALSCQSGWFSYFWSGCYATNVVAFCFICQIQTQLLSCSSD